ncbi:MAG: bifunctional tetrahydrofolate synthase/dihydrofolate synthase [Gammaproteobacteria bacterium]|nr:bifunctional tetrahydrofolate synthase/dihydrofolate synthase [Gammaproteobacteria bacterium]
MRLNNLQSWLSWQETLHSSEIELGLDRVRRVAGNMGIKAIWHMPVITVAGTNGKGSSVAMLEAIYQHAGYRVGSYTSPHLISYNERIKIDRQPVADEIICQAFEKIDQARKNKAADEISLTYFEFGTLAALSILAEADLDVVILEVGLGGRLDAVNIIDAAVAMITPIAIDHQSWLGNSRDEIAKEKAGIIKSGALVVYNDADPARPVIDKAHASQAPLYCLNKEFMAYMSSASGATKWRFKAGTVEINDLPVPLLEGNLGAAFQLDNAAASILVSQLLSKRLPIKPTVYSQALADVKLAGRFQYVARKPDIILDVAHNTHAISSLAANLAGNPCKGRTYAVVAMLEDKAICDALVQIDSLIDRYYLAGLQGSRTLSVEQLQQRIQQCISSDKLTCHQTVEAAIENALSVASSDDRIIIFGSFVTVSAAMQWLSEPSSGD